MGRTDDIYFAFVLFNCPMDWPMGTKENGDCFVSVLFCRGVYVAGSSTIWETDDKYFEMPLFSGKIIIICKREIKRVVYFKQPLTEELKYKSFGE